MYICLCNPFSVKDVRKHLDEHGKIARVTDVYTSCSDGEKPNCCKCLETLKEIVTDHNDTAAA